MNLPSSLATDRGLNTLQFAARALFAMLATLYFAALPALHLPVPKAVPATMLVIYLLLHTLLMARSFTGAIHAASVLDLLALGVLLLLDPAEPPPTLALIIVAVLSTGLLGGLRRFLYMLAGAVVILAVVLPLRQEPGALPLSPSTLFLLAVMLTCALYFGLLLYRNLVLTRRAEAATWQDPETGLLSRTALAHTAGWLQPLHERLSSPLTAILLRPHDPAQLPALANSFAQRLRRSDIGARADEHCLVLLLPDTDVGHGERVLTALRAIAPPFTAVMAPVPRETSLDLVLDHLTATFQRGAQEEARELIHAPPLRL